MSISVVSVPTALGLSPNPREPHRSRGTWRAPRALISTGLIENVGAADAGEVRVEPYRFDRDTETGIYNRIGVAHQTLALADQVGPLLDRGERVVVLGGDCSVLLGPALALRRRGRCGLVFIDGHLDSRHLGNSPRLRAAAGEDLAIVTGRGLDEHADIDGLRPYFRDGDVVALGDREHDPATDDIGSTAISVLPGGEIQSRDARSVTQEAVVAVADAPDGYWIHVDVDVLDSDVMPAVDSPQPGGLLPDRLAALLRELWSSPHVRGLDLTVYDPELDPDGTGANLLSTMLQHALVPRARLTSAPVARTPTPAAGSARPG